jgi:hypothetical protein
MKRSSRRSRARHVRPEAEQHAFSPALRVRGSRSIGSRRSSPPIRSSRKSPPSPRSRAANSRATIPSRKTISIFSRRMWSGRRGSDIRRSSGTTSGKLARDLNQKIEEAWCDWARRRIAPSIVRSRSGQLQDLIAIRNVATDGEVFIRHVPGFDNKYRYAIQLIDADQVDHTFSRPPGGPDNEIRLGIEIDKWGAPVAYYVNKRHPSDWGWVVDSRAHRSEVHLASFRSEHGSTSRAASLGFTRSCSSSGCLRDTSRQSWSRRAQALRRWAGSRSPTRRLSTRRIPTRSIASMRIPERSRRCLPATTSRSGIPITPRTHSRISWSRSFVRSRRAWASPITRSRAISSASITRRCDPGF